MANDDQETQPSGFRPIAEAPIQEKKRWGPALIVPSETGWYAIAEWDGTVWTNMYSGALVQPAHYLPLPSSPASISVKI